ncbi:MAG: hypothetical protein KC731_26500 [Myxococcales bacterium]|nr:hypothetical protein [Myxococcales bacterium]
MKLPWSPAALVLLASGLSACEGPPKADEEIRAAKAAYARAWNAAITGRKACAKTHGQPAWEVWKSRSTLAAEVRFGTLSLPPATSALCAKVFDTDGEVVSCDELPSDLLTALKLKPMASPCGPSLDETRAQNKFTEDIPRPSEKEAWLKRVAEATEKLEALSKPATAVQAPAYVLTRCASSGGRRYEGTQADGSRVVGSAGNFTCEVYVVWLEDGKVTAMVEGRGNKVAEAREGETLDTLTAKNQYAQKQAIAMAAKYLLANLEERRPH